MQGIESYWGRRALDFVDAIEASATGASVISQFEKVIGDLGFHASSWRAFRNQDRRSHR